MPEPSKFSFSNIKEIANSKNLILVFMVLGVVGIGYVVGNILPFNINANYQPSIATYMWKRIN